MTRQPTSDKPTVRFISMRWRSILPLTLAVLVVAMLGAYGLMSQMGGGFASAEENLLRRSGEAVLGQMQDLDIHLANEAQRIAYTVGVPEAIRARQPVSLHALLEGLAAAGQLDSAIVTDSGGIEVAGLLRTETAEFTDYSIASTTSLANTFLVQPILAKQSERTSGILLTPNGPLLYTAVPIRMDDELVGVALVGRSLANVVAELRSSALAHVTLYDGEGQVLNTSFDLTTTSPSSLQLDPLILAQVTSAGSPVEAAAQIGSTPYRALYLPLTMGNMTPMTVGVLLPDTLPFATELGRQMASLFAAALSGTAVVAVFAAMSRVASRVERVTEVANAIAQGQVAARVEMPARDEVGRMAAALDSVASAMEAREDKFRTFLRRERRERSYMLSILESIPDGVLVYDKEGKLILMNQPARVLLGANALQRAAELQPVADAVLGPSIAPGLYSLGDPREVEHGGQILRAQAAAVLTNLQQALGTVVLLRDMTDEVKQSQAREQVLAQLNDDMRQPLATLSQQGALHPSPLVNEFAREIARHSAALQKMIVDMRELTQYNRTSARHVQRPLAVETLLWALVNDWRQIAAAAGLTLQTEIGQTNLYVLGDESKLRLALGNLVDNAIKYTPSGGAVSLEIKGEVNGAVHVRIRDNGVGISRDDLSSLFIPFYRGTPVTAKGEMIRVPGMGQGLAISRQIVEAHGGVLKVKSKIGVGTAVYLALPLTAAVPLTMPPADYQDSATIMLPDNVDMELLWKRR